MARLVVEMAIPLQATGIYMNDTPSHCAPYQLHSPVSPSFLNSGLALIGTNGLDRTDPEIEILNALNSV